MVGVLGALVITSEYATGSIRTTLSITSKRTTVLAAKLLVIGVVVLVVAEVTAFASFFVGQAVLLAHGAKALPAGELDPHPGAQRHHPLREPVRRRAPCGRCS